MPRSVRALCVAALFLVPVVGCDSRPPVATTDSGSSADAGGSPPPPPSADVCEAYIACVAATTPEGLAVIVATYGMSGSCWEELSREECEEACLLGIEHARLAAPDETACPDCLTNEHCDSGQVCLRQACVECGVDSDCPSTRPACSLRHTCVGCTQDGHCPEGVCDLATQSCVGCRTDADCAAPTPVCSARRECVQCSEDSDCGGGRVCSEATCCTPTVCDTPTSSGATPCGVVYDPTCNESVWCSETCARGTCDHDRDVCSLAGQPCTPGEPDTCLPGETCVYKDYPYYEDQCAADSTGLACASNCPSGFLCGNGGCGAQCLDDSYCPSTRRCAIWSELGYGSCVLR